MIFNYLLKFHTQDCSHILESSDTLGFYSINIDFMNLFETYPHIGDQILCSPIHTLPLCDKDIIKAQEDLLEREKSQSELLKFRSVKKNVHARFFGLPVCPELHRSIFPKNVDKGCFLKVTGTVVRATQAKMLEYHRIYACVKCKHENLVEAQFENRYVLKAPTKCGNSEKKCKSTIFNQVNLVSREHCKDYQEIKIQEQVNKLSIGTIPGALWVVLEDDLVDSCKPGDDVSICGTVRRRWRPSTLNKKTDVDLVLQANYIQVCNAQRSQVVATAPDVKACFDDYWETFGKCPVKGRDLILASVAPQVYGLHLVKLALLLTVITGSNHMTESDSSSSNKEDGYSARVRGQCHLLLVGDPGTGKSQLLSAGAELTPRSVFTAGSGTTRAGLTCAALREEGEWQLEAGALVLSDGGVCCIDEIGQLRENDRTSIHEAMEQQTISIAKAGIVCKLNTRCAVVAACNPKGHYQTDQPLSANVALGTPLLSRFDLIFILLDTKNNAWDKLVSSYILHGGSLPTSKMRWTLEKLQMYIALVGPRKTTMTKSANIILQTYYMAQRKSEVRDPSRTTVRMLDSLVRLSQAHCRLMYRKRIQTMDAIVAVSLVDLSMQDCTLTDTSDALHSTIPNYPDYSYLCTAKKLLTKLNLYEIWQEELIYYSKVLQIDHKSLESYLDKGNVSVFVKYDDVTDINVPLSAAVVTSSYFNKDKVENASKGDVKHGIENNCIESKISVQNNIDKLGTTLKKHGDLNKGDKSPLRKEISKGSKWKRKEVIIDTSSLIKPKKVRKKKSKIDTDENEEFNENDILKAVPSAFDIFGDLDINIDFDESITNASESTDDVVIKEENISVVEVNDSTSSNKHNDSNNSKSSVADKLKQFQFKETRDLSKLYDETINKRKSDGNNDKNINASKIVKTKQDISDKENVKKVKEKSVSVNSQISIFESSGNEIDLKKSDRLLDTESLLAKNKSVSKSSDTTNKSVQNSQISIFESSDCDIDLDL